MSHVFSHLKLRTRLLLVLASIVLIQALISGSFTLHYIKQVLEERILLALNLVRARYTTTFTKMLRTMLEFEE